MKLSQLLEGVQVLEDRIGQDVEITSLSSDTRTMQPGALFVALPGYHWDGNDFVEEALARGAAAVLCSRLPAGEGPWLRTEDPRADFARLSSNWFGNPAAELCMLAVTGTNGKTTTTYLLKAMLEGVLKAKVGLIGTNQNMVGELVLEAQRTTPEAYELQALLRQMADAGCSHVVMEVSSHSLLLHRVDGIFYRAAIFTNLSQDHLDFHGDMERYRDAKAKLFTQCETGIFNLDDEAGRHLAQTSPCKRVSYSENKMEADLRAVNIRPFPTRVEFEALTLGAISRVKLPIPGGFSIYNALGVIACGLVLGLELPAIAASLSGAAGIKGRIEVVPVPAAYTVIIDYAHTPAALENILLTAREFTKKRLICLFGCGGDRDRSKRAVMGSVAAALSDLVFLSSDNPRSEDPEEIIDDVLKGMGEGTAKVIREADRRQAIRLALAEGEEGDVIVLAGKGHETYQEIKGRRIHLDEREEIRDFFATQAVRE